MYALAVILEPFSSILFDCELLEERWKKSEEFLLSHHFNHYVLLELIQRAFH